MEKFEEKISKMMDIAGLHLHVIQLKIFEHGLAAFVVALILNKIQNSVLPHFQKLIVFKTWTDCKITL